MGSSRQKHSSTAEKLWAAAPEPRESKMTMSKITGERMATSTQPTATLRGRNKLLRRKIGLAAILTTGVWAITYGQLHGTGNVGQTTL